MILHILKFGLSNYEEYFLKSRQSPGSKDEEYIIPDFE